MAYKIERDKKKHFYVGIPLGFFIQLALVYMLPVQPLLATTISIGLLVAGCYAFELFSLVTGMGYAEHLDALAGILGGVIGIGLCILVKSML
jgi:hypothetical protein